jgi:hypothetical protein
MKFCHFCAGNPMLPKVTIPQPEGKPIVIVQCSRCQRIETDDEA